MKGRFKFHECPMKGLVEMERVASGDERGWFERMFCQDELKEVFGDRKIVQVNRTMTAEVGVVRGMHSQSAPHAELKMVSCLRGEVFDVAVDLRRGSPTFLHWHGVNLSADNRRSLLIPEGFAHGFQTLTTDCEMLYFHTAMFEEGAEFRVHPNEPRVGVEWPEEISLMSERDTKCPFLDELFEGVSS
jgi:dTDP-4-dehydrorhamnose 3,5-epimerase